MEEHPTPAGKHQVALTSLQLCWDQPFWPRYGLTLVTAMSNSLGVHCALWLLWMGYPDSTVEGTTWLPLRRGTRSPPQSGAGTRHSWPGGRQSWAWWCDPWGISSPAIHLQPSKPRYGVGHGSCMGGVEQVKRVRREPLGASCLGHSQVRGGSPSRGHPPLPRGKQQLHPGDQDQVSAMFEAISCSCCCTLHPHGPKASLDGKVPISHPASGRAPRLPCDDALWGQEEESEPWFPHALQSSFLSSLP